MGRPKASRAKRKVRTEVKEKLPSITHNTKPSLGTLLKCSFVEASVSGHSLTINLKVEPEQYSSSHKVFNAFIHGYVTCKTVSAEVLPVEIQKSCDACGEKTPRQETVLTFTIGATDLRSDCNICHDHGSLSKFKKCEELLTPIHGTDSERIKESEEIRNVSLLGKSVGDKQAQTGKMLTRRDEMQKFIPPEEQSILTMTDAEENLDNHADLDFADDDGDEDWKMTQEGNMSEKKFNFGPKKKKNIKRGKKKEKKVQRQPNSVKKTFTCAQCGKPKKYAKGKCNGCSDVVEQTECKYCEKTFETLVLLDEHKLQCEANGRFLCTLCGATFARKYNLTKHKRNSHEGIKDYKCEICHKSFFEMSQLKIHKRIHTGERPYQCDACGKSYTSASSLRTHRRFHNKKLFECCSCNKTFFTKNGLLQHESVHSSQEFVCSVCGKKCFTKLHLTKHVWTHNRSRSYKCNECPKAFFNPGELKIHQRIHTGERPFACTVCEKTFTMGSSLKKHILSHGTEKPYKCDVCQKEFVTQLQHYSHVKIHKERKFICEICGKRFVSATALKSHDITHSGIKKNTCDLCGKSYRSAWYLQVHKKTHTGENLIQCHTCGDWFTDPSYFKLHQRKYCKGNPVYCQICNRAFPHNRALNSHMGLHTGERPFGCDMCGKAFSKPESLSEHVKRHEENTNFKCKVCGKCFINANELRKHEVRHSRVKMKASLPDSLKPGQRDVLATSYQAETQPSKSVQVESFQKETRQASFSHGTQQIFVDQNNVKQDSSPEGLEEMINPIDLRPVVQYSETSKTSNMHMGEEAMPPATSVGHQGDVVYTRPLPPANQVLHMVPEHVKLKHSEVHSVIISDSVEEVQILCSTYE